MTDADEHKLVTYLRKKLNPSFHDYDVLVRYRDKFKWCIDIFGVGIFIDLKQGWELLEKILEEDGLTKRSNLSEQELDNYINILKLKGEI